MRRVYGIYIMRMVTKPAVRLAAFLTICLVITSSVSMPNVIANALHSNNLWSFSLAAIAGTKVAVQFGILAALALLVWTIVDAFRTRSPARFSA